MRHQQQLSQDETVSAPVAETTEVVEEAQHQLQKHLQQKKLLLRNFSTSTSCKRIWASKKWITQKESGGKLHS